MAAPRNSDLYKKVLTFAWEYYTANQLKRQSLLNSYGALAKEYALFIASKDPVRYQINNLRGKVTVKIMDGLFQVFYSRDQIGRSDYEMLQLALNKGLDFLHPEAEQVFERIEKVKDTAKKEAEIEKTAQEITKEKISLGAAEVKRPEPPKVETVTKQPEKSAFVNLVSLFKLKPAKTPQAIPLPPKPISKPVRVQAVKLKEANTFTKLLPIFIKDSLSFLRPVGLDALSKAKIQTRRIILKNPFEVGSLINGLIWAGFAYSKSGDLGTALISGVVGTVAPYAVRGILQSRAISGPGGEASLSARRGRINPQTASFFGQIGGRIRAVRAVGLLANPVVLWTFAGIALFILLIIIFPLIQKGTSLCPPYKEGCQGSQETTQAENKIEVKKTGPEAVGNGERINYQISVKNLASSASDVTLTDTIQANTKYIESDPAGELSGADENGNGGTITWKLDKALPSSTQTISLVTEPQENDIWVVNQAEVKTILSAAGGGETVDPGSLAGVNNFNTLMTNQGRNINIIAGEDNFVATVTKNASNLVGQKESFVREIYKAAVSRNVNPLTLLAIWGTETGFRLDLQNVALSCPVRVRTSFAEQVACAAKTYDNWMKYFEQNNKDGKLALSDKCVYTDPFVFATEKYGPTCSIYDGNDNFLSNFVKFYKQFLGAQ